ncbi:MFS transporter [Actinomadura madurae]|uniref:MFS transporter n=1 Tax=Actinomadura madurae TaxID=1993 RepID=UPI0020D21946|nr:MFS transporter [Actinomadura madurae]MCP9948237.1 MFS transporter [Actinomadura madurae]MCP9965004.1 MFS transporter [Actinomadura madurae]MCP9977500.1 MFS transporter [Actinomadura madurae]MCQ0011001.1 MFS transporter [Actinomadura madurae]MCQ0013681.1 MFS transporter [Actinomadura madurae]
MSTPEIERPRRDEKSPARSTEDPPLAAAPPRSTAHYVFILVIVLLMAETTTYGATAFVTVLPHMIPPFTPAQLPWVFSVTLLVAAAIQPLMGKLADVFGRKRILMVVAVVFIVGSLVGALTTSFALIMVARVLQASAVALPGVIYSFFREYMPPRMVPVAVGMGSTATGVAILASPLLAGALLSVGDYHGIFWFCAAYMLVFGSLVAIFVPSTRPTGERSSLRQVDLKGSLLLTLGALSLLIGITQGGSKGWGTTVALLPIVIAVVLLVGFLITESRVREPMIPLQLLRTSGLSRAMVLAFLGQVPLLWTYMVSQMLQTKSTPGADYAFGLSASKVGVVIVGWGLMSMVFGPLSGYLTRRISPRRVMIMCLGVSSTTSLLTALFHDKLWYFVVFAIIGGIAGGSYYGGLNNLIIESVPGNMTGVATGFGAFCSAFTSSAIPVIMGAILSSHVLSHSGHKPVYTDAGYTIVFLLFAACALVGLVIAIRMRYGRALATGGAAH